MISVVMIDSRSDQHPDWVQLAKNSVLKQAIECELIVIDNIGRKKTIGECWNEGVGKATNDLVFFLGDDDWIAESYLGELFYYASKYPHFVMYTTNMTTYHETEKLYSTLVRICTGMWRREYLIKYPFNEKLQKGIDREYIQEMQKRGDVGYTLNHNFGYYYRQHEDYSCAGKIRVETTQPDYYVLASYRSFIDPLVREWKKKKSVYVSSEKFNPQIAEEAEMIWCEFAKDAVGVGDYECKAKKILRLHAYEAFSPLIYYIKWEQFDKVIFIANHIKEFVESKVGKLPNAEVIPVGIHISDNIKKEKNNKIAYAGEVSRKKGVGELLFIAKSLPDYEFHIAGKFNEEDTARHFNENRPDNVFVYPYSYDLPKFFEDKTYIINTSLREGNPVTVLEAMACGLKPLINDWIGAKEIYGEYVFTDLTTLKLLLYDYEPDKYRKFAEKYQFNKIYKRIEHLLEENNEKNISNNATVHHNELCTT